MVSLKGKDILDGAQFPGEEFEHIMAVADGMGGAAAGELASEMAATQIYQYMIDTWGSDRDISEDRFAHRLREAVELANLHIHSYAREHPDVRD